MIYFGWGSTFLAVRYAVDTIPPFVMAGTRNLVAGVVLVVFAGATGGARPSIRQWAQAALLGGLMFVLNHGGISWASQRLPSGVAALMVSTIPLWIVLMEWGSGVATRPKARVVVGIVLGLAGSVALLLPRRTGGAIDLLGGLAAGLGAVAWATGTILSRRLRIADSVAMATGLPMIAGGLGLYLVAVAAGEWRTFDPAEVSGRAWAALVYLISIGSLIGFSAYTWLLRSVPATRVATYAYVNPIVALALGATIGGEPLSAGTLAAGALSLAGVYLVVTS